MTAEPETERELRAFFESYARLFEQHDASPVADLLAYPCLVAGDDGAGVRLQVIADRAHGERLLAPLLRSYAELGVVSARQRRAAVHVISAHTAAASVEWVLHSASGEPLYDFSAAYTLVQLEGRWRITAIAHDELARSAAARLAPPGHP